MLRLSRVWLSSDAGNISLLRSRLRGQLSSNASALYTTDTAAKLCSLLSQSSDSEDAKEALIIGEKTWQDLTSKRGEFPPMSLHLLKRQLCSSMKKCCQRNPTEFAVEKKIWMDRILSEVSYTQEQFHTGVVKPMEQKKEELSRLEGEDASSSSKYTSGGIMDTPLFRNDDGTLKSSKERYESFVQFAKKMISAEDQPKPQKKSTNRTEVGFGSGISGYDSKQVLNAWSKDPFDPENPAMQRIPGAYREPSARYT